MKRVMNRQFFDMALERYLYAPHGVCPHGLACANDHDNKEKVQTRIYNIINGNLGDITYYEGSRNYFLDLTKYNGGLCANIEDSEFMLRSILSNYQDLMDNYEANMKVRYTVPKMEK